MSKIYLFVLVVLFLIFAGCRADDPTPPDTSHNTTDSTDTADTDTVVPPDTTHTTDTITEKGTAYVYDITALPTITIVVSTDEWNRFLADYDQNPNNEEYVHSGFRFERDGKHLSLADVGLRLRGNTSRRRPEGSTGEMHSPLSPVWHHASFAVNFGKYVKDQKMAGIDKVNLKWFKDDASYVREVYCYDLFERYGVWTAPQSSYCRLKIKIKEDPDTIYYGVYQMVEPVDKDYLKVRISNFADASGFLWKANYGADLVSANVSAMDIERITLSETYTPVYDLKTATSKLTQARTQLADFITNLNSRTGDDFKTWIETKMDVPLFLKTYAVNVVCGMWDDYWCNKNNFYLYFSSSTGKFYFIPFDYDNTLGTSAIVSDAGRQDPLAWGNASYPLTTKILAVPAYKALYTGYLRELCGAANDLFYVDKSIARIQQWQSMIRPWVSNDTGEDMYIADKPASWGNCSFYRLLDTNNNFFRIKQASIP